MHEKCLYFRSASTDRKPKSEPTNSQTNTANLNVCHPCCVYVTRNNKDAMRQYTGLYYSNHKLLKVSAVQGSHHQAVRFRNVKEENYV